VTEAEIYKRPMRRTLNRYNQVVTEDKSGVVTEGPSKGIINKLYRYK